MAELEARIRRDSPTKLPDVPTSMTPPSSQPTTLSQPYAPGEVGSLRESLLQGRGTVTQFGSGESLLRQLGPGAEARQRSMSPEAEAAAEASLPLAQRLSYAKDRARQEQQHRFLGQGGYFAHASPMASET